MLLVFTVLLFHVAMMEIYTLLSYFKREFLGIKKL